jgi:hypothetical protein
LVAVTFSPGERAPRAHAGVDDGDVERACREREARLPHEPGGGADVVRRDVVGKVHDRWWLGGAEQRGLELGDIDAAGAEVGGERDDAGHETGHLTVGGRPHSAECHSAATRNQRIPAAHHHVAADTRTS